MQILLLLVPMMLGGCSIPYVLTPEEEAAAMQYGMQYGAANATAPSAPRREICRRLVSGKVECVEQR